MSNLSSLQLNNDRKNKNHINSTSDIHFNDPQSSDPLFNHDKVKYLFYNPS